MTIVLDVLTKLSLPNHYYVDPEFIHNVIKIDGLVFINKVLDVRTDILSLVETVQNQGFRFDVGIRLWSIVVSLQKCFAQSRDINSV